MTRRRLTNRFSELLAAKARREGRGRISIAEVVKETGLARNTVDGYVHNTSSRYDAPVILALCDYLGCSPAEFFVVEQVEAPEYKTALLHAVGS